MRTKLNITPKATLSEIQTLLNAHFKKGEKVDCPACGQLVLRYERPITSSMVLVLFLLYKHRYEHGDEFVHVPTLIERSGYPAQMRAAIRGDWAKLKYWQMIKAKDETREDGSARNGFWKITSVGQRFIQAQSKVPKFAYIFDHHLYGMSDELIDVETCLRRKFSYEELMRMKLS